MKPLTNSMRGIFRPPLGSSSSSSSESESDSCNSFFCFASSASLTSSASSLFFLFYSVKKIHYYSNGVSRSLFYLFFNWVICGCFINENST